MARSKAGRGQGATAQAPTIAEVKALLQAAGEGDFAALERSLLSDTRKGVQIALDHARRRLADEAAERGRVAAMYSFERSAAREKGLGDGVIVGLDEVGRGPVAGPLAVAAVVLPEEPHIAGLNDSKKVAPEARERIADCIKETAVAWAIAYIQPDAIDACGMSASLRMAFLRALADIEAQGVVPDAVLIDGNPLRIDPREVNMVKGDAKCASVAAASIVAKVERDALMCRLAEEYPEYGFESCKGYASADHIAAIKKHGLSPVHRATFCTAFTQQTLF